jgi:hypothetical protein
VKVAASAVLMLVVGQAVIARQTEASGFRGRDAA